MVRVAATKIERLIGLAGEVVVNTRWLPLFSESIMELKRDQSELSAILEGLLHALGGGNGGGASEAVLQAKEKLKSCNLLIADKINRLNTFISHTTTLSERLYRESVGVRMRPFAEGGDVRGLPRMVRDLSRRVGKKVKFEIVGKSTEVDRDILEKLNAPLTHLIRNAVDHGIEAPEVRRAAGKPETGSIRLQVEHRSGMLMIRVSDDGRGVDPAHLKKKIVKQGLASGELVERLSESELMDFLFLPGFSTASKVTEISGRGVGLDIVHNMVHEVGGVARAFSKPGEGLTFLLELPLTLSVIRTLLVTIAGETYAFPLARIDRCMMVAGDSVMKVEDRQYFRYDDKNIALVNVHRVLETSGSEERDAGLPVVVVSDRSEAYGIVVDGFLGECELVVRTLDPRLGKVPNFSAAALLLDGTPVLIFDIDDLICSIVNQLTGKRLTSVASAGSEAAEKDQKRILVVDDSITVRELERKMLEHEGYLVDVAVDGMDGWNAVRSGQYAMVVSDVDMPRMNGIELISQIREHSELKALPIIIISYKDQEEDRLAGLQAGANYYLTKSSFQDRTFIQAVADLIGDPDDKSRDSQ
jgi:two-component system sensor histidine kinase and response regulator WspE